MRKKILVPTTLALLAMLFVSIVNAQAITSVTVRTNKANYLPGEKGTIHIDFYNGGSSPISIHNVTLIYNGWQAYIDGQWVGNETIEIKEGTVKEYGVKQLDPIDFVVPSDGRGVSCGVSISVGTSDRYEHGHVGIAVTQTTHYMEQILTLFTVQVVLLIVCTIIIAATIFLSARRPQVTWKHEEK